MRKTVLTAMLAVSAFVAYALAFPLSSPAHLAVMTAANAADSTYVPDTQPSFPGGLGAIMKFMSENVALPEELQYTDVKGKVVVKFTVAADGAVTNARVEKSLNPLIDNEVVKALLAMPKWTPATLKGQPVATDYFLPVKIDLAAQKSDTQDNGSDADADGSDGPQFPGGKEKLYEYIVGNTKFPEAAKRRGLKGCAVVGFNVEGDGSVDNLVVMRTTNPLFEKEAARVVASMPKWIPGKTKSPCMYLVKICFGDLYAGVDNNFVSYIDHEKPRLGRSKNNKVAMPDDVGTMPSFPGGAGELLKFLNSNVHYPEKAVEAGIQDRVIVSFVVETDGSITNVKVASNTDPLLDIEAMRVVASMPRWIPGCSEYGEKVRVKYNVPVKFGLGGSNMVNNPLKEKDCKIYAEGLERIVDK